MDITIDCEGATITSFSSNTVRVELNDIDEADILDKLDEFNVNDIIDSVGESEIRECLADDYDEEPDDSISEFINRHSVMDIISEMNVDDVLNCFSKADLLRKCGSYNAVMFFGISNLINEMNIDAVIDAIGEDVLRDKLNMATSVKL